MSSWGLAHILYPTKIHIATHPNWLYFRGFCKCFCCANTKKQLTYYWCGVLCMIGSARPIIELATMNEWGSIVYIFFSMVLAILIITAILLIEWQIIHYLRAMLPLLLSSFIVTISIVFVVMTRHSLFAWDVCVCVCVSLWQLNTETVSTKILSRFNGQTKELNIYTKPILYKSNSKGNRMKRWFKRCMSLINK